MVATHRHKDHISGFATNKDGTASGDMIAEMMPELVIQPWTEDPNAATDAVKATGAPSSGAFKAGVRQLTPSDERISPNRSLTRSQRRKAENAAPGLRASTTLTKLGFLGETNLANPSAVKNLMEMGKRKSAEYLAYGDTTRSGSFCQASRCTCSARRHLSNQRRS